jgi:hypothetical protein
MINLANNAWLQIAVYSRLGQPSHAKNGVAIVRKIGTQDGRFRYKISTKLKAEQLLYGLRWLSSFARVCAVHLKTRASSLVPFLTVSKCSRADENVYDNGSRLRQFHKVSLVSNTTILVVLQIV